MHTPNRPQAQPTTDRLHDVDSAADYLRCGRRLIYRLVAERKIRHTKAGRSLRFWQSDLDAYLDARAVEPTDVPGSSRRPTGETAGRRGGPAQEKWG